MSLKGEMAGDYDKTYEILKDQVFRN